MCTWYHGICRRDVASLTLAYLDIGGVWCGVVGWGGGKAFAKDW